MNTKTEYRISVLVTILALGIIFFLVPALDDLPGWAQILSGFGLGVLANVVEKHLIRELKNPKPIELKEEGFDYYLLTAFCPKMISSAGFFISENNGLLWYNTYIYLLNCLYLLYTIMVLLIDTGGPINSTNKKDIHRSNQGVHLDGHNEGDIFTSNGKVKIAGANKGKIITSNGNVEIGGLNNSKVITTNGEIIIGSHNSGRLVTSNRKIEIGGNNEGTLVTTNGKIEIKGDNYETADTSNKSVTIKGNNYKEVSTCNGEIKVGLNNHGKLSTTNNTITVGSNKGTLQNMNGDIIIEEIDLKISPEHNVVNLMNDIMRGSKESLFSTLRGKLTGSSKTTDNVIVNRSSNVIINGERISGNMDYKVTITLGAKEKLFFNITKGTYTYNDAEHPETTGSFKVTKEGTTFQIMVSVDKIDAEEKTRRILQKITLKEKGEIIVDCPVY